jgi:hypothetical protein
MEKGHCGLKKGWMFASKCAIYCIICVRQVLGNALLAKGFPRIVQGGNAACSGMRGSVIILSAR